MQQVRSMTDAKVFQRQYKAAEHKKHRYGGSTIPPEVQWRTIQYSPTKITFTRQAISNHIRFSDDRQRGESTDTIQIRDMAFIGHG